MTLLELISKQLNGVYHLGYLEFPNHTVGHRRAAHGPGGQLYASVRFPQCAAAEKQCLAPVSQHSACCSVACCPSSRRAGPFPLHGVPVLLLSSGSRKNSPRQGLILAAMALVPVCLLCGILYLAWPRRLSGPCSSLPDTLRPAL